MQILSIAARLFLALVFLTAGMAKARDQKGFHEALGQFGVPPLLVGLMALLIPALELGIAAGLLIPAWVWYGALGALAVLLIFFMGVSAALVRRREPDCHCFGQLKAARAGRVTLVRIALLASLAGWLTVRGL
jgi:uncharacterized membrane protein YphA (DoxX/SURF4 family)